MIPTIQITSSDLMIAQRYGATAFLVYCVVKLEPFLTIDSIAKATNLSRKSVSKSLGTLEAENVISCRLTSPNKSLKTFTTKGVDLGEYNLTI